ncbi:MAG: PIN domain-containing protein [Verrucomicrobia bacterium]|nr:PIN domain-containing protein [Verrucomicrobiota bacterium]MCH8511779.1 PIN domain-containing protein [Kiritimatiellia bacterium]
MVTCADTSFLFSLYGNDANTPNALDWLRNHPCVITVTRLNDFELGNALRFSEFKQFIPLGAASKYWRDYQQDRDAGRIRMTDCNLAEVLASAVKLSEEWTLPHGHRSFDILHVAGALVCKAHRFLTFDHNQSHLAHRVGMTPCPVQ